MRLNHTPLPRTSTPTTLSEYIQSLDLISNSLGMPCLLLNKTNNIIYVNNVFCIAENLTSEQLLDNIITSNNANKFLMYQKFAKQINQQHQEIIELNQRRIYLEIDKSKTSSIASIVYKTPILDLENNFLALSFTIQAFHDCTLGQSWYKISRCK